MLFGITYALGHFTLSFSGGGSSSEADESRDGSKAEFHFDWIVMVEL